jgi:hypothetical protein
MTGLGFAADEFPRFEKYFSFLLYEGNHKHLELNITIMKFLSNLKQLRNDHTGQKYTDHDVFRDDSDKSLTLTQTARRSKKQKMATVLSQMNNYNDIMQRLDEISQKPLSDLTPLGCINFEKDFGLLTMQFQNQTEFVEWLRYWYMQRNAENRKLVRDQNRTKVGIFGLWRKSGPIEPLDSVVNLQIEKLLTFTRGLLQQKRFQPVVEWNMPTSLYA